MSNQNMLETNFPNYESTGVHSTSNSERLASAYPKSPIHSGQGKHIVEFSRDGIKQWYDDNVLNGSFDPDSDFLEGDYDYANAPTIPNTEPPEGEAAPGEQGSTIVSSGKGSNVATINLNNLAETPAIDASPSGTPPGVGVGSNASPSETSETISQQSVVRPNVLGKSSN